MQNVFVSTSTVEAASGELAPNRYSPKVEME